MLFEAEVLPGLEKIAAAELIEKLTERFSLLEQINKGELPFKYKGPHAKLTTLRTVVSIYRVEQFPVPRPRALLGQEHLTRLVKAIREVLNWSASGSFHSFRLSAAGRDSAVFSRISHEIEDKCQLKYNPDEGELLIRIRKAKQAAAGWEVLLRLTPRPLSTRSYRHSNLPYSLNASIAAALVRLSQPSHKDRFLNLMCGSSTIAIERALFGPAASIVAIDLDRDALASSSVNIASAGLTGQIGLMQSDSRTLPIENAAFDVICSDLPWGERCGREAEQDTLYQSFLSETARIAAPQALLIALTQRDAAFERAQRQAVGKRWKLEHSFTVFQGGFNPRVFLLRLEQR